MILNKYFKIVINKTARNIKLNDQKNIIYQMLEKYTKKLF